MSTIIPTCPTDCSSLLPVLSFDLCAPDIDYGQIRKIYLTTVAAGGLTDWTDLSEWNSRLSNSTTNADDIRYLHVIGNKDVPEYQEIDISLGRKVYSPKIHKVMFRVDETGEDNYEFMRSAVECNGTYLMWYASGEKYLYGGDSGIEVNLKLDLVIPEDSKALTYFQGEATWESKFHPERIDDPLL